MRGCAPAATTAPASGASSASARISSAGSRASGRASAVRATVIAYFSRFNNAVTAASYCYRGCNAAGFGRNIIKIKKSSQKDTGAQYKNGNRGNISSHCCPFCYFFLTPSRKAKFFLKKTISIAVSTIPKTTQVQGEYLAQKEETLKMTACKILAGTTVKKSLAPTAIPMVAPPDPGSAAGKAST